MLWSRVNTTHAALNAFNCILHQFLEVFQRRLPIAGVAQCGGQAAERGCGEAGGLARSECAEYERADDEGEDRAGVVGGELGAGAAADRFDLGVEQTADLGEQRGVADGLGEDADPAAGGDRVGGVAEGDGGGEVGVERLGAPIERAGVGAESLQEVADQAGEQVLLASEVMVDEAGRDAGFVGGGGDRGAGVAVAGERAGECGGDLGAALVAHARASHRLVVQPIYRDHHEDMTAQLLEQIPWNEVEAVGIRTTADGPMAPDMFWQFLLPGRLIELPSELVAGEAFDALGQRLPGIDWTGVARASGSTDERIFGVWRRGALTLEPPVLRARFVALIERLGGDAAGAAQVAERLLTAWGGDERRYHDLRHLVSCLEELDAAEADPQVAQLVELALWYHDAIYLAGARDSEERSAQLLLDDAAVLKLSEAHARAAAELVRATAHLGGGHVDGAAAALIVDIDLAILGRDAIHFMDFEYSVGEEYAAIPALHFRVARGRFLASLLASPRIYRTERFRARYEAKARATIRGLLQSPRYRAYRWLHWLPIYR